MASKKQLGQEVPGITYFEETKPGQFKKIVNKDWLYQKYVIEELPVAKIAKLANINDRLVTARAKEYGFPIRSKKRSYELRTLRNEAWNKGLTKETHPTLKATSERQKKNSHFADPAWREKNLFTEEVKKKRYKGIRQAHQKKWSQMSLKERSEQLKTWWEGKSPNNTEQMLLELAPNNVEFTGNGAHWVTFKCGRNKNPDYVVRPFSKSKKVIEYFGSYWHPDQNEKEELIKKYNEVGVNCLVILEEELVDIEFVSQRIKEFIL